MVTKKVKPAVVIVSSIVAVIVIVLALFVLRAILHGHASNQADAFLVKHDYPNAINAFKEALRLEPNDPDMRYVLAITYQRNGQKSEALATFQQLASKDDRLGRLAKAEVERIQQRSLNQKQN